MVKHGLEFIPTSDMTREQWLSKRQEGLGGSDMSSILGLNHGFSAIELFYQKVGFTFSSKEENEAMFWGSRNEDNILHIGQYYDFGTGEYIKNYNTNNQLRKITKFRYMVRNQKFPWIVGNLDGAVNFLDESFKMDGPAEAKAISRQSAEMWENGIPPYHLVQIATYCTVCESMMNKDYANIFYLEDGNKFRGYSIPLLSHLKNEILTQSYHFWQLVLRGREIVANEKDKDKQLKFLAEIEPKPDHTDAYYYFLSDLFKRKESFVKIDGGEIDLFHATNYKRIGDEINHLEDARQIHKNHIMKSLHDRGANIIDFGDKGKVTWNKKLYINVKNRDGSTTNNVSDSGSNQKEYMLTN